MGVAARGKLFGDVEGDVENVLIVIGKAGRKNVVAHFGAVQVQLGEPETGVVDGGAADLFLHLKFLAEQARGQTVLGGEAGQAPRRHAVSAKIVCGRPGGVPEPWFFPGVFSLDRGAPLAAESEPGAGRPRRIRCAPRRLTRRSARGRVRGANRDDVVSGMQ